MLLYLKRAAAEQLELRVALLLLVSLQKDEIKPAAHMEPGGGGVVARPECVLFQGPQVIFISVYG